MDVRRQRVVLFHATPGWVWMIECFVLFWTFLVRPIRGCMSFQCESVVWNGIVGCRVGLSREAD